VVKQEVLILLIWIAVELNRHNQLAAEPRTRLSVATDIAGTKSVSCSAGICPAHPAVVQHWCCLAQFYPWPKLSSYQVSCRYSYPVLKTQAD